MVAARGFLRFKNILRPRNGLLSLSLPSRLSYTCVRFISCTSYLLNGNVDVTFRNGFPVMSVPLPSRRENCEFILKPLSHTVKDFIQQLKDEDKGIERAVVYNMEGTRISQSTGVDVLLQSDFKLLINDETYPVHPPEQAELTKDDARAVAHLKTLVHQLYSSLNIEEHQLEKERMLLKRLEDYKHQIEPLERARKELDIKAARNANIFVWSSLAFMALQFGFLARLTWWEYSWDIMEPVTYFVGYGTAIICYAYFVITRQEYTYVDSRDRQYLLSFHKTAKRNGFNVEKYNNLKDSIQRLEEDLKELRSPFHLYLPPSKRDKVLEE